jgi:hypothetical protein
MPSTQKRENMRNDQADAFEMMWWLPLSEQSDSFFDDMQKWWYLNHCKDDREWQDLSYWEVANVAMMYLAKKDEWRAAQLTEDDMYAEWAGSR